jgi:hypothetical protein
MTSINIVDCHIMIVFNIIDNLHILIAFLIFDDNQYSLTTNLYNLMNALYPCIYPLRYYNCHIFSIYILWHHLYVVKLFYIDIDMLDNPSYDDNIDLVDNHLIYCFSLKEFFFGFKKNGGFTCFKSLSLCFSIEI